MRCCPFPGGPVVGKKKREKNKKRKNKTVKVVRGAPVLPRSLCRAILFASKMTLMPIGFTRSRAPRAAVVLHNRELPTGEHCVRNTLETSAAAAHSGSKTKIGVLNYNFLRILLKFTIFM